jgi:hypothetical protein
MRKILLICLFAFTGAFAGAGAAARPPAHAHKPAPAAQPAAGPFDARDPASLVALLAGLGAKAEIARREADGVFLTVTSPTEVFSAQFAGCDAQGRNCQALLFDRQGPEGQPTLAQINAFNQTSVMCRLYQDKAGRAHVEYSALLFPRDGRAEMLMHVNAWRGCIGDFKAFLKDPAGFLANAP